MPVNAYCLLDKWADFHNQVKTDRQYFGISTTAGGGVLGRLRSSTPSPSPSPTRRSRVGLGLGRGVLELKLHEVPTTDSSQVR